MYTTIAFVLFCACLASAQQPGNAQQPEKQFKPGEFDSYNEAAKDINANAFPKAITDLDAWGRKYPDSDYRNERQALYVQAYAGANQPGKSLDAAALLVNGDLNAELPGPQGQATILRLLYNASWAIAHIQNPGPDELAAAGKAARELLAREQPLPGISAAKWAEARADMREKATAALVYIAMLPGIQAMAKQPPDCAAAEAAYTAALREYPDRSIISWELGRALTCETKDAPDKAVPAIYEFQRAAVIDPKLGEATRDPKQVQSYADNLYVKFHGSDEGLEQIRQTSRQSPFPPAGFRVLSAAEVANQKNAAFDAAHPEMALWIKIRTALMQPAGEQYFESGLKGTAVPQLVGALVEAKPACRPRELLVAVPLPDSPEPAAAEILLKLDKPFAGKPEPGAQFRWEGVPSAFSKEPFLLAMDAEIAKIEGLGTTPCSSTPVRKAGEAHGR